jgi:hypothetical protein
MDRRLQADRLVGPGRHRTYRERLSGLPDGAMVRVDDRPWLVLGPELLAWTPGGYGERRSRDGAGEVTVLTPRSTVAALRAGYQPVLHPSRFTPWT